MNAMTVADPRTKHRIVKFCVEDHTHAALNALLGFDDLGRVSVCEHLDGQNLRAAVAVAISLSAAR